MIDFVSLYYYNIIDFRNQALLSIFSQILQISSIGRRRACGKDDFAKRQTVQEYP
jgi:hypothetical protein